MQFLIREVLAQAERPRTEEGVATLAGLEAVFNNVISVAIALAGIVFFLMLVIGGFRYITAGGEPPQLEAAKKTLTYAVAGLVFIALSYLILRFIANFTGVESILDFRIYQP